MERTGTAIWNGSGKDGNGQVSTQSGVIKQAQYSYKSRFEQGIGTNPEELIAAAHAGCFAMKLSFILGAAGFTPDSLEATSSVTLTEGVIRGSKLSVKGKIPGITPEKFKECVEEAKNTCPVSKALGAIELSAEGELV
ncbi:MAG TPA: OsmC family protein [Chitinophagaceae bacterium]